jgi:hypothetical protein
VSTQSPIHGHTGLSPREGRGKKPRSDPEHSPLSSTEVKKAWSYSLVSHRSSWRGAFLSTGTTSRLRTCFLYFIVVLSTKLCPATAKKKSLLFNNFNYRNFSLSFYRPRSFQNIAIRPRTTNSCPSLTTFYQRYTLWHVIYCEH